MHPRHHFLRVEYTGALMGNGAPAIGVEAERIVFNRFSGYRTKPGQVWGPPIWGFAAQALCCSASSSAACSRFIAIST
ncbi:hypothetical protein [Methylobacterium sp. GC_Met_3]|uniref:hypothetical protein n=1 Tax=Methylobacterium sp. GC_Met_3 TaxID=2937375 RepID=UPI002269F1A9|nr:hypothetical protein [Methylobacterium sp. GC_Met_3]